MDILSIISTIGTDDWISGVIAHNKYIIGAITLFGGAWLKGKYPDFWSKLSTAIPFIGHPGPKIG